MSVLVLTAVEVEGLLTMEACVEAMTEVLASLARGELHQPLRFVVQPPRATGMMGFMPAHRSGPDGAYSLKEIVVTPGNPEERGLDAHQGAVLLHDGTTGELRALLNAAPITAIRTAAVSAVATRALARPDSKTVAIVGTGVQGKAHEEAMRTVFPEAEITAWSRRSGGELEPLIRAADVVCTCTNAPEPVLRLDWLGSGVHVNAVGSSGPWARELDVETLAAAALFVDRRESAVHESGEYLAAVEAGVLGPEHILAEIGEVLTGAHPGRSRPDELTVFKSLGLAVEDLAAAELIVARARREGVGTEVDF